MDPVAGLFFGGELRQDGEADLLDPLAVEGFDGKYVALEGDLLAFFGKSAVDLQEEPG